MLCDQACERGAIDHNQQPSEIKLDVGTIIAATGYDPFDPSGIYQYGYGRYSNVITGMEIERMINASGPTGGHVANHLTVKNLNVLHSSTVLVLGMNKSVNHIVPEYVVCTP